MAVENDIVLIHIEDNPVSFARVEDIKPDVKKGWYVIRLFLLQVPVQAVSWILKDVYINGEEFFMGGKKMRLEVVHCPKEDFGTEDKDNKDQGKKESKQEKQKSHGKKKDPGEAKIISFADMKKKRR